MAFDISTLTQYINASSTELIAQIVGGANDFENSFIKTIPNIKAGTIEKVYVFENDIVFQNEACTENESGSTTIGSVDLAVCLGSSFQKYCGDSLAAKYPQLLSPGKATPAAAARAT